MDFTSILEEATARTGVSETISRSDTILKLAERHLNKELRGSSKMQTTLDITTDASGNYTVPADFNGVKSLFKGRVKLHNTVQEYLKSYDGEYGYRVVGSAIETGLPNTTLSLTYYATLPNLKTNTTNWLSNEDPELYIYAIMWQALTFQAMREDDMQKIQTLQLKASNMRSYLNELISSFVKNDVVNSYQGMRVNVRAVQ